LRRAKLEFTEEGNSRNTRELADERCDPSGEPAGTAYGNEYSMYLSRLEILDDVIHCLAVQCAVISFARCINTQSLFRSEQGGNGRKIRIGLRLVGH
jgi:hypothetical protein